MFRSEMRSRPSSGGASESAQALPPEQSQLPLDKSKARTKLSVLVCTRIATEFESKVPTESNSQQWENAAC